MYFMNEEEISLKMDRNRDDREDIIQQWQELHKSLEPEMINPRNGNKGEDFHREAEDIESRFDVLTREWNDLLWDRTKGLS